MSRTLTVQPLTQDAFALFGDVLEPRGDPTMMINQGKCGRYHDLARLDFGGGQAAISIFEGTPYTLPLDLAMMERHPLGSQAFVPMSAHPYLVIVAPDVGGVPGVPCAFRAVAGQGVNYLRNVWHAVLTPMGDTRLFAVVDRVGPGDNVQEYWFDQPWRVVAA